MNTKTTIKTAVDLLMTAALPVLMCYSIVGETAHEIVGVTMFVLFILLSAYIIRHLPEEITPPLDYMLDTKYTAGDFAPFIFRNPIHPIR